MDVYTVLVAAQARLEATVPSSLFVIGDKALAPTPNRVVTGRLYLERVITSQVDRETREREIRMGIALEVLSQQAKLALQLLEQVHQALDAYPFPDVSARFFHLETRWVRATPTVWTYQLLFQLRPY